MKDIPLDKVAAFQDAFLDRMRTLHKDDVLEPLSKGKIDDDITAILRSEAEMVALSLKD